MIWTDRLIETLVKFAIAQATESGRKRYVFSFDREWRVQDFKSPDGTMEAEIFPDGNVTYHAYSPPTEAGRKALEE